MPRRLRCSFAGLFPARRLLRRGPRAQLLAVVDRGGRGLGGGDLQAPGRRLGRGLGLAGVERRPRGLVGLLGLLLHRDDLRHAPGLHGRRRASS